MSRPRIASLMPAAIIALLIVASFLSLTGEWSSLFSRASAAAMADLFGQFLWPSLDPPFLRKVAIGALETISMSWIGTLLATAFGLAMAIPAAGTLGPSLRIASRLCLNFLRAVPELVWAALLVIATGLGPFPGTLALALHTTGVLGRLFADALENTPPEPALALRRNGVGPMAALAYATLPAVITQLLSYSLYRWENNIRAAAVLGVAGAGGLGQMLFYHLSLFHYRESGTVLMAMLLLVAAVDGMSSAIRVRIDR